MVLRHVPKSENIPGIIVWGRINLTKKKPDPQLDVWQGYALVPDRRYIQKVSYPLPLPSFQEQNNCINYRFFPNRTLLVFRLGRNLKGYKSYSRLHLYTTLKIHTAAGRSQGGPHPFHIGRIFSKYYSISYSFHVYITLRIH